MHTKQNNIESIFDSFLRKFLIKLSLHSSLALLSGFILLTVSCQTKSIVSSTRSDRGERKEIGGVSSQNNSSSPGLEVGGSSSPGSSGNGTQSGHVSGSTGGMGGAPSASQNQEISGDSEGDAQSSSPQVIEPKIGIILGGGALRTFAHIGVLQEFSKRKTPIVAVAGIEMGSLVAALFSQKGQAFDVEWQMMKIKEKDLIQKSLLSGKAKPLAVDSLADYLNQTFSQQKVEQFRFSFSCPSLNIEQQRVYILSKGTAKDMLPYCIAMGPLYQPHMQNVAGLTSVSQLAEQLRAKGANYIIYVDVLSAPLKADSSESSELTSWSLAAENARRKDQNINLVVQVPMRGIDLLDFSKRRESLQKGQQAGIEAYRLVQKELNL